MIGERMPHPGQARSRRRAEPATGLALRACAASLALMAPLGALFAQPQSQPPTQAIGPLNEVPFVTTPDRVTLAMLELAGVNAQDHVLDLGSGDGRIVITAARRFGASGFGVEIDPQLVERSRLNAQAAGVADRARFAEQDLFKTDLTQASVITMYLLPDVNLALRPRLLALQPGTRIVSHDWDMGDWAPDRSLTLSVPEKTIGREKISRVHFWVVPAQIAGRWCAPDGQQLEMSQRYQRVEGRLGPSGDGGQAGTTTFASGQLDGPTLNLVAGPHPLQMVASAPDRLRVTAAAGPWSAWLGRQFSKGADNRPCPAAG